MTETQVLVPSLDAAVVTGTWASSWGMISVLFLSSDHSLLKGKWQKSPDQGQEPGKETLRQGGILRKRPHACAEDNVVTGKRALPSDRGKMETLGCTVTC